MRITFLRYAKKVLSQPLNNKPLTNNSTTNTTTNNNNTMLNNSMLNNRMTNSQMGNNFMPGLSPDLVSRYEKYSPLATPFHVEGIWRAPRAQGFTKEQFDRAYPESYKKMKIGLPKPGTFAADYVDPKFDEVSPLVWTCILMSPLIFWALYEFKQEHFPSKNQHH